MIPGRTSQPYLFKCTLLTTYQNGRCVLMRLSEVQCPTRSPTVTGQSMNEDQPRVMLSLLLKDGIIADKTFFLIVKVSGDRCYYITRDLRAKRCACSSRCQNESCPLRWQLCTGSSSCIPANWRLRPRQTFFDAAVPTPPYRAAMMYACLKRACLIWQ